MVVGKDDVTTAVGNLQLRAGQDAICEAAICEAAIHLTHDISESDGTKAILLEDAENALSSINRQFHSLPTFNT